MSLQVKVAGGQYLKAEAFAGDGVTAQVTKAPARVPTAPKYADEEGLTTEYYFTNESGELIRSSNSTRFATAWNNADIDLNDWVNIRAEGEGTETQYFITKVDAPTEESTDEPF